MGKNFEKISGQIYHLVYRKTLFNSDDQPHTLFTVRRYYCYGVSNITVIEFAWDIILLILLLVDENNLGVKICK